MARKMVLAKGWRFVWEADGWCSLVTGGGMLLGDVQQGSDELWVETEAALAAFVLQPMEGE
jgi:hypothetical protein